MDVIADFAAPLPAIVTAEMLGVPTSDHLQLKKWSADFEPALIEVMRLLDQQDEQSTERAKRLVNERVTQWLKARRRDKVSATELAPIVAVAGHWDQPRN